MAENIFDNMPGFGKKGAIEDCSICIAHDPGTVTITFNTASGESLLVLDPKHARIASDWLKSAADRAEEKAGEAA